jgi:hypothetical protein
MDIMKRKPSKPIFEEAGDSPPNLARKEILSKRINELSLKISGSRLEGLINKLYKELEEHNITFKPKCYLADEWGCPDRIPTIGIPFYLADPELSKLEGELTGIEAEDDEEIMMYLRHEAGHAFNYAYKLFLQPEWRSTFGLFSRPYREEYQAKPFNTSFVRHIPGWYAQKHPDDDFAETFAVWLTPGSNWKEKYDDTPALTKLLYVDRIVKKFGQTKPKIVEETPDTPVEEIDDILTDWYQNEEKNEVDLPRILDEDLRRLFNYKSGYSAALFLNSHRRRLRQKINFWTGASPDQIEDLIEELIRRLSLLDLTVDLNQTEEVFTSLTCFLTTLIMNHLYTNNFVP